MSTSPPLSFGVILYPGFQALDVFGPLDALNTLALTSRPPLTLSLISSTLSPVSTKPPGALSPPSFAFTESVVPTHTYATAPPLDVLLIPGGLGVRDISSPPIQDAIAFTARVYPGLKHLITVCTGSVVAALAGVLDGRRATTNKSAWEWVKDTAARGGSTARWVPRARWVVDGNVWTSSGVSAGLDVVFAWIAQVFGEDEARRVADVLEYERHVDPSWDPFAELYGLSNDEA
ncbi:hypothetical protein C0992_005234 [Termitomyces sp. T32_za158]|nr:hypothetical protein C0992_005234 [Termitomyces sp. T32_za158]